MCDVKEAPVATEGVGVVKDGLDLTTGWMVLVRTITTLRYVDIADICAVRQQTFLVSSRLVSSVYLTSRRRPCWCSQYASEEKTTTYDVGYMLLLLHLHLHAAWKQKRDDCPTQLCCARLYWVGLHADTHAHTHTPSRQRWTPWQGHSPCPRRPC